MPQPPESSARDPHLAAQVSAAALDDPQAARARRFNVGDALHEGMTAFRRAPRTFVLYAALLTALQVLVLPLQERIVSRQGFSSQPLDISLFLVGISLSLLVSLWGTQGMVRGAWAALQGQRPSLISLLRWDGAGCRRLVSAWTVLGALLLVPLLVLLAALLGLLLLTLPIGVGSRHQELMLLATLLLSLLALAALGAFGLLLSYVAVNQQFLAQIALLERCGGATTLQRGRRLVDHQWVLLLLLLLIKGLLLVLGMLLAFITLGIGWLLAWPLVSCITTAAYRQLREREALAAPVPLSPAG